MGAFGIIAATGTIRFERKFEQPLEVVWKHLTQPRLLSRWLASAEIQIREGGYVELSFAGIEGNERRRDAPNISGVVSRCDPPHSLSYWWTDARTLSNVTFELEIVSAQVRFLLTHGGLPLQRAAESAASWHAQRALVQAVLQGHRPAAYAEAVTRVFAHYAELRERIRHHGPNATVS